MLNMSYENTIANQPTKQFKTLTTCLNRYNCLDPIVTKNVLSQI